MPRKVRNEGFSAARPKSHSIDPRSNRVDRTVFLCVSSAFEIYHARDRARLGGGRI